MGEMTLPTGATLLLYTDGLIEDRTSSLNEGLDRLAKTALAHFDADPGAMIDEILEFTRGGPSRLKRRQVGVEELLAKLQRLIEPDMASRGIRFTSELGYAGTVSVDLDRILRAMLNIASNALDAMEPGGTFAVRSRGRDGLVEIDLSDTGRGIPLELQPRIYEPFFTHGKPRGIGLGMSITRKIVEEHGGRIRLESELGRGTTFTVCLPADPVLVAAPPSGDSVPASRPAP